MKLHYKSFLNRLAKMLSRPLSSVVCSRLLYSPFRQFDAYLNFLLGRNRETVARCRCRALRVANWRLLFEFGSGNINSRTFFRELCDLITSAGFRIWRLTPSGGPVPIDEHYEDLEYFRAVSDYMAELKDHLFTQTPRPN